MGNEFNNKINSSEESNYQDEIDLKDIFLTFIRNKKLIAKITLFSIILGLIQAYASKKVWKGEFQIVLTSPQKMGSMSNAGNAIGLLSGIEKSGDPLMTEVGILKSPLVLSSVFDFVKEKKSTTNLRFNEWKKESLEVNLEKNTTILKISYEDTEQKLIIPVLEKISKRYQEYSGRKRKREIQLGKDFFEEQIEKFKQKNISSLRATQEFAIEQNLSVLPGDSEMDKEIVNSINIEKIRVNSANKIKNIEVQLEQLANINDLAKIQNFGKFIPELEETTIPEQLEDIETDLAFKRLSYRENDKAIKSLVKKRDTLLLILRDKARGFLEAEKTFLEAKLKAAERPKGVLIKYKQLLNNLSKDQSTLDKLENQYRALLINEAKTPDPWELITRPTLLPDPIAPIKKRILLNYIIFGLLSGSLISYFLEKRKGIIYSISELKTITKLPLLMELSKDKKTLFEEFLEFLFEIKVFKTGDDFAFLPIGELDNSIKTNLSKIITSKKENSALIEELKDVKNYSKLVILASLGITKRVDLIREIKKLSLLDKDIVGIIVLNSI